MAKQYGTLAVLDSLATYNNTNVIAFGEEELAGFLNIILDAHNMFVQEIMQDFVAVVPNRETTYGVTTQVGEMVEVDEYGLADAQKIPFAPSTVGFPLRRFQYALQWTRDYLAVTSPAEVAQQVLGITIADELNFYKALRKAMFRATNYTVVDEFTDKKQLAVKALVNGDSAAIPPQPVTAATFDAATHTHYLATASFIEANLAALIETVREHGLNGGNIVVYANAAQETTIRGFAGFEPYVDARIIYGTNADRAAQATSQTNLEDRPIGFYGVAEVWIKPWMPASYVSAVLTGGANEKPIGMRMPEGQMAQFGQLRIAAELDRFPLHARAMQRMFGMGGWNRLGAAVLYTASGTYASFAG